METETGGLLAWPCLDLCGPLVGSRCGPLPPVPGAEASSALSTPGALQPHVHPDPSWARGPCTACSSGLGARRAALSLCCVLAFSCGCVGALLEAAVPQGWVWGHLREGLFQRLDKETQCQFR